MKLLLWGQVRCRRTGVWGTLISLGAKICVVQQEDGSRRRVQRRDLMRKTKWRDSEC